MNAAVHGGFLLLAKYLEYTDKNEARSINTHSSVV